MSLSFVLVCPETKQKLWVGQGHHDCTQGYKPVMEALYSGAVETEKLREFLNATYGKQLALAVEDYGKHNDKDGWITP